MVTAMNITTRERRVPITFFFSSDEVFFTPSTLSTMAFMNCDDVMYIFVP